MEKKLSFKIFTIFIITMMIGNYSFGTDNQSLLMQMKYFTNSYEGTQSTQGKTIFLTLKDAILLSLRYNTLIRNAEMQRVIDKFTLAVAKNEFEFKYVLAGLAGTTETKSGEALWSKTRNYILTPGITRKNTFGTEYGVAMVNPLVFTSSRGHYLYNPSLTFSVKHPLLKGSGQLINEAPLEQAYVNEESNKLAYRNTVMQNVTQVILDYRNVVSQENAYIIAKDALKSAQLTVEQNNLRIKTGFMAPSENAQAEYAVANQAFNLMTAKNAIIQAKIQLLQDIGLPYGTRLEVDKKIVTDNVTYPKGEEAKTILFCNNITYLTLLNTLTNSRLSLLLAEDAQRWTLDLAAAFSQGPGSGGGVNAGLKSLFNGSNVTRSVGIAFSIPIDDLSSQSQVVNSKVSYDQQKLLAKQTRLVLESQLDGTLDTLRIEEIQMKLAKQAMDLINKSYQDSLKLLSYGKVSVFEVTTIQSTLVSAQLSYVDTQIQYLNEITNFQFNLGITLKVWGICLNY